MKNYSIKAFSLCVSGGYIGQMGVAAQRNLTPHSALSIQGVIKSLKATICTIINQVTHSFIANINSFVSS